MEEYKCNAVEAPMLENRREEAINALRAYLIELLEQRSWCMARTVGQALELLVGMHLYPHPVHPQSGIGAFLKNKTLPEMGGL